MFFSEVTWHYHASWTQEALEASCCPILMDAGQAWGSLHPQAQLWAPQAGRESAGRSLPQVCRDSRP